MTKVTIITPTWQASEPKLNRCLDSVQRQTEEDYEHIVCSDGDHEETASRVVSEREDRRVRYVCSSWHHGHWGHGVRREMLNVARGEYICFLDDDNIIFPTYLEKMLAALDANPAARFAICAILHYGPVIPALGKPPIVLQGEPTTFYIDTLQVLAETAVLRAVGWQGNNYESDGLTYEALGKAAQFVRVEEVLGVHH